MVPLLSKIRTKEPAVMMGTLAVQEAMGMKVDREAVATLVLPQLWALSIGPCKPLPSSYWTTCTEKLNIVLSLPQFHRFMGVIRTLTDRISREHEQFLRDQQRTEDRSSLPDPAATSVNGVGGVGGVVDFESLVGQAAGLSVKNDASTSLSSTSWDDSDPWGSILGSSADVSVSIFVDAAEVHDISDTPRTKPCDTPDAINTCPLTNAGAAYTSIIIHQLSFWQHAIPPSSPFTSRRPQRIQPSQRLPYFRHHPCSIPTCPLAADRLHPHSRVVLHAYEHYDCTLKTELQHFLDALFTHTLIRTRACRAFHRTQL
jgi:hypothetical protein